MTFALALPETFALAKLRWPTLPCEHPELEEHCQARTSKPEDELPTEKDDRPTRPEIPVFVEVANPDMSWLAYVQSVSR